MPHLVDSDPDIAATKRRLRTDFVQRRNALDAEARAAQHTAVLEHLATTDAVLEARHVGLYAQMRTEFDTLAIAQWLHRRGVTASYPVTRKNTLEFVSAPPDRDGDAWRRTA